MIWAKIIKEINHYKNDWIKKLETEVDYLNNTMK